ncbi:uncharacterized protein DNG_03024 [Cephalotrichum gorgonifer]|uniref:Uncharacterized protein n=1 Tax=Cephalotrichum gorgonifer TaxID=2041049 RepID=A0AAE8MUZ4_9PEZI|nr:uncharacterized protein DNG_03024 [Cephalotrichum gorgonifer]
MAAPTLAQACRALRVPCRPASHFRCVSTATRQPAKTGPPASNPKPKTSQPAKTGPFASGSKPDGQKPKLGGQKLRPASGQKPKPRGPALLPSVLRWAHEHNVGFVGELKTVKLASKKGAKALTVKYSPRQTFSWHHITQYFTHHEHTMTEYWLYRYEEQLADPLWLQLTGSTSVKPVVRNFGKRRIRQGIHAAMAERGYTPVGKVAEVEAADDAGARPTRELKGTVSVTVHDPLLAFSFDRETCLEIGREIVRHVESQGKSQRR